ncbi:hypothetical protein BpHYR1_036481 [Brachionus plicatilis]|uniref:Uncharacterized protein n=1 Tax=Brachionus plicatilis TaxID=10195 RepID=A0A3M7P181_BRAPC|nr:hypothetical protein BpHYR1_036481 [Brachionus plicatilis]
MQIRLKRKEKLEIVNLAALNQAFLIQLPKAGSIFVVNGRSSNNFIDVCINCGLLNYIKKIEKNQNNITELLNKS